MTTMAIKDLLMTSLVAALCLFCATRQFTDAQLRGIKEPPLLAKVPVTSFSCDDHMAGYFADMEAGCQAYHMCDTLGKQYSYLCPNMTVFNQRFMVCDHWNHVNCSNSGEYYKLNKRMAGGGKKLPQANRRANIVLNNKIRKERVRKRLNKKKTSPKNSKVTMRKMKIELKQVRKRIQTTTMKPKLTTNNIRHSNSQFPRTNTRSSFLRPLITTTPNSLRATLPRRSTTKAPPAMKKGIALNPNPRSRETKNNASSGTISRNKFTTALPRNSVKKVTEINNFAGHNNTGGLTPLIQMFPGMVARGSGPRFGFGFTKIKESSRGQHVQRNFHDNPLFLEISRQILKSRDRIQFSNRSQSSTSQFMNGFRKFNDTPEKTTSFKINPRSSSSRFVFPKLGNDISFPIKHRIIETITPKPILMTGRRQEDITELKAKRNGGNRGRTDFRSNPSSISRGNQAFFIPETRLIPPDNIMITDRLVPPAINSVSAKNNSTDDEDHMTMMFQETKHDTARTLGGFFLNPDCPKCHPAFLSPGRCSPCVRIR